MSTVILDTPFPAMHIVEKAAFSTEGRSISISLNSQSESISNEQLLKMLKLINGCESFISLKYYKDTINET